MSQVRYTPAAYREGSKPELRQDMIFDILSNERRQCALHYLMNCDDSSVDLSELVDYVAAWENGVEPGSIGGDPRKRVYTALRQSHLPRMEEAGIIEYEKRRGTVRLTERADGLRVYLEYVPNNAIPWSEYYLGLVAVGAALVTLTWVGIPPFGSISGLTVATILVVVFAVSAAIHTYQMEKYRIGGERFELA